MKKAFIMPLGSVKGQSSGNYNNVRKLIKISNNKNNSGYNYNLMDYSMVETGELDISH